MFKHFLHFPILFDDAGGDGGAGAGAGPGTGTASPGTGAGAGSPGGAGAPAGGGAPAPPAEPSFSFKEDRGNWVSPDRVSEYVRAQLRGPMAENERLRAMLEAGTGYKVPPAFRSAAEREEEEARAVLHKLLPGADKLFGRDLSKFFQVLDAIEQGQNPFGGPDPAQTMWDWHGQEVIRQVTDAYKSALGLKELTPFQARVVGNSFVDWVTNDKQNAARYTQRDPTLIKSFIQEYQSAFLDPARRTREAPLVPGGGPRLPAVRPNRGPAGGGPAPKPKTEDEVHDNAFRQFAAAVESSRG